MSAAPSPACSAHHVLGVPVGPVLVRLAGARLVLAVRGRRAPQRLGQVGRGGVRRVAGDAAGQAGRDLLQQPAVAVRVAERGEGAVARVLGRGPADAIGPVGLELRARRPGWNTSLTSTPVGGELVARGLDVGDDQVQAPGRAGRRRGHLRAELDRRARAGRRELDDPEAVVEGEVGVEPPPQALVEAPSSGRRRRPGCTTASSFRSTVAVLGLAFSLLASVLLMTASSGSVIAA